MSRKKLTQIQQAFEQTESLTSEPSSYLSSSEESPDNSLTASLQSKKKKTSKIRFTLDLEKPLDHRLTKAAIKLNRTKADLTRIALSRLLEELEAEWKN